MTSLKDLPIEVVDLVAGLLTGDDLRNFGLTSWRYFDVVSLHAARRVSFDGSMPALGFFERYRRDMHAQCDYCKRPMVETTESKPEGVTKPLCVSCLGRDFSEPRTRLEQIKQVHLNEVQALTSYKVYQFNEQTQSHHYLMYPRGYNEEPFRNPDEYGSNLIGATISLCPNLEVLKVTNTPIPVTRTVTRHLRDWCTKLREFTYLGKAFDTTAMAYLVQDIFTLETLAVSGVKTCECQGVEAENEAIEELGKALRDHQKLTRLSFTSCRALKIGNGRLLDILAAPIVKDDVEMTDDTASASAEAPKYGDLKLKSLELHRCPILGQALSHYLSSPPAAHLKHLYIGGCKSVKAQNIAEAVAKDTKGLAASNEPLDLEIDADLISRGLFKRLQHRITRLRLFEPTFKQYCILTTAIEKGYLPRLTELVVLPPQEELPMWGVRWLRFNGTRFVYSSVWSASQLAEYGRANMDADEDEWVPRWGHLKEGLRKWLSWAGINAEVSVGDRAWQEMRENRAKLGFWKSQGDWERLDLEKYGERRRSESLSVGREGREQRRRERRHSPWPCRECRKAT